MSGTDMFGFADAPPGRGVIVTKHRKIVKPSSSFPSSSASSSSIRPVAGSSQRTSQVSSTGTSSQGVVGKSGISAKDTVQARLRGEFETQDRTKGAEDDGQGTAKRTRSPTGKKAGGSLSTSQQASTSGKGKKGSTSQSIKKGKESPIKEGNVISGPAPFPMRINSSSSEIPIDDDPYTSRARQRKKDSGVAHKKNGTNTKKSGTGPSRRRVSSPDPLELSDASADCTISDSQEGTPTKKSRTSSTKGKTKKSSADVLGSSSAANRPIATSTARPTRPVATSTARPNRPIATSTARPSTVPRFPATFSDTDSVSSLNSGDNDEEETPRAKQRREQESLLSEEQRRNLREIREKSERKMARRAEKARSALERENRDRAAKRQEELDDPNGGAAFFRNLGKNLTLVNGHASESDTGGVADIDWIGTTEVDDEPSEPLSLDYRQLLQTKRDDLEGYTEEEREYLRGCFDPDDRCEYCDGALPRIPSLHLCQLKSRLIRLSVEESSSQTEPGQLTLDWRKTIQYCALHKAETTIIPLGLRQGYPDNIDFTELQDRVEEGWIRKELEEIMFDPDSSAWFNKVVKDIAKMGKGKWRGMTNQNEKRVMDMSMPGYYGNFGREVLVRHYENLHTWNLLPPLTSTDTEMSPIAPLTPSELFRHVIAPEAGIRLIMADQGWKGDKTSSSAEWSDARREAYVVWKKSRDFGRWKYREESEEAREILEALSAKDAKTREACERSRKEDPTLLREAVIDVDDVEEIGASAIGSGDEEEEGEQTQVDPDTTQIAQSGAARSLSKRPSQALDGDELNNDATPRGKPESHHIIEDETPVKPKQTGKKAKGSSQLSTKKGFSRTRSAKSNASTDYGDEIDWAAVPDEIANSAI